MSRKLYELTPEMYLRYKRTKLHDRHIARLYNCSTETLRTWKKERGLIGVTIRKWETWEKFFPEEFERLKKKITQLHQRGWKQEAIAEELGMSRQALSRFIAKYLPHLKAREVKVRLSKEQLVIIKRHGLKVDTVLHRIRAGFRSYL